MKRVWCVAVLLTASVFQSNAQTAIPFYGFELSNYEVGDTLEYYTNSYNGQVNISITETDAWIFKEKNVLNADTIMFVVERIHLSSLQPPFGPAQTSYGKDTIEWILTNAGIYGSANNVLGDTLKVFDSIAAFGSVSFDTINGLKHLSVGMNNSMDALYYQAEENLGLVMYNVSTSQLYYSWTQKSLMYAHLQNHSVVGQWQPIYLSTNEPAIEYALVEYDFGNKTLMVKTEPNKFDALQLFDVSGRCVLTAQANAQTILLNHLPTGMYFYKLTGKRVDNGKFLIR